ncbi:MAG: hypothetical protein S4CHLAM45_07020 [Chlamydiales bacterium]|nr:hypothetical protein [Chlamydiales bacterium]MCH9620280.1 hypothetical protein [Chlamydiales bacterium]MCH9622809.1 hypothetical protein [Chlamydiales bacterium]
MATHAAYPQQQPLVYHQQSLCANLSSVILKIVVAVFAATAAYHMFSYGQNQLNLAVVTRVDMFVGGVMTYMGVAYGVVSLVSVCRICAR